MPHYRTRILEALIKTSLSWSPIVGVVGSRQVGKTTILSRFAGSRMTFDNPQTAVRFESAGQAVFAGLKKPLFLDEIQKYPPAFDLLKMSVDEARRPGSFIITGSIRFSLRKGIRESLTGRSVIWELLPLTLSECHRQAQIDLLGHFASRRRSLNSSLKFLEGRSWAKESHIEHYLKVGGMPGICFLRDEAQRSMAVDSYVDALVGRDLSLIRQTKFKPFVLLDIVRHLADTEGSVLNYSAMARRFRTSVPTMKSLVEAFEALFLIRRHGRTLYFEDVGVGAHLRRHPASQQLHLEGFVYFQLKAQVLYQRQYQSSLSEYFTRGGAHVPFVIRSKGAPTLGICVDAAPEPSEKTVKSLYSFHQSNPDALLLAIHTGSRPFIHKERILCLPWIFLG